SMSLHLLPYSTTPMQMALPFLTLLPPMVTELRKPFLGSGWQNEARLSPPSRSPQKCSPLSTLNTLQPQLSKASCVCNAELSIFSIFIAGMQPCNHQRHLPHWMDSFEVGKYASL